MLRKRTVVLMLFFGLLVMIFSITPVRAQESDDSLVRVPDELTTELKIKVAYNGQDIFWLFEWPVDRAHFYHDVVVYQDGDWVRHGASPVGSQEFGLYEDRLTFLVDPGTVQGFATQGCYAACHDQMRFLNDELDEATIAAHPLLGETLGRTDLRKYLADSRTGAEWWDAPWDDIKSPEELEALREAGVFLDFWHWRAHRGGPVGYADDQYVLEFRNNDGTKAAYATNWDADVGQPRFMFDPAQVGFTALNWDRLINFEYTQDDVYYLSTDNTVPFDPDHNWQNGDVIPRRFLQQPEGSQASITADGRWADGVWRLELRRAMDTGFPTTDHALVEGRTYNVGFAIHKNATGSRWHYISHLQKVGIGTPAAISAVRFNGSTPDWNSIPWTTLPMYYPGQITWEWLTSDAHPGAPEMRADSRSCRDCHGEDSAAVFKMAQAAQYHELREGRLSLNWWLTLIGGFVFLFGGTIVALNLSKYKEV
ncbi:MAG: hypothetical protein IAE79_12805 [Anaerolinea sp.]|nr:hypothetical protein [Anaerolinea sp.]